MSSAPDALATDTLEALSDAELVTESLPCASHAGCYRWLVAFTLPVPIGLVFNAAWALLSFGVAVMACRLLAWRRERNPRMRRARQAEAEFARRFGEPALERALVDARALLATDRNIEAVVCLHGCGLPHGGPQLVGVDLGSMETTIRVHAAPWLADLWQHPERVPRIRREVGPLTLAAAERLRACVAAIGTDQGAPEDSFVKDGFPCTAVLLKRGAEPQRWQLNMSGLSPEQASHPVAQLIASLLELSRPRERSRRGKTSSSS
jgi:hypothetical protein